MGRGARGALQASRDHPPDAWLGPILDLHAQRALLDFWWSIGGKILWPWGNVALLGATLALAAALGLSSDRRAGQS